MFEEMVVSSPTSKKDEQALDGHALNDHSMRLPGHSDLDSLDLYGSAAEGDALHDARGSSASATASSASSSDSGHKGQAASPPDAEQSVGRAQSHPQGSKNH